MYSSFGEAKLEGVKGVKRSYRGCVKIEMYNQNAMSS